MRNLSYFIVIATVAGCGNETRPTQPQEAITHPAPRYDIVKFSSSLGGTPNRGTAINDRGWIAGFSTVSGNQTRHAVLWRDGSLTDLGALGGPGTNSSVVWPGINNRAMVVGITEIPDLDPLHEEWSCTAFLPSVTGHMCRGFFWESGEMTLLPTLGGNQGFATGVNDWGQVVGWAETPVHDPTCNDPQVLQFRAVLWEPKAGRKRELPPLHGDSTSAATAINERGQVVGISGDCDIAVGRFSARHAVLWEHGRVTELPNLGGTSWHTPMAINKQGDIVGFSNPPDNGDGTFLAHAFLWTRQGGIQDLKTLPGDATSQAMGINSRGQVVGVSSGSVNRAFLWQDGVLMNLNDLKGDFPDSLVSAQDINEVGQITGRVYERSSGKTLTFVAAPRPGAP
jgi:probable HAF family extracellular repeat protein